ncbi:MAG: hypothetical protein K2N20_02990 [Helicobacter sp.]|nr:hypothetical protein [Helicobacter sp.]
MLEILCDYMAHKDEEYRNFDPARFPALFAKLRPLIDSHFGTPPPTIVHIVGTNGKGSTGRFLALMLRACGKSVGHFVSPHLFSFADRFWDNGAVVSETRLLEAHRLLQSFVDSSGARYCDKASYFEYATLLAYTLFYRHQYVVLEAGLGGELDSTASLPRALSLITPIHLDHEERLGKDIFTIALTKLRSVKTHAIIGIQPDEESVRAALKVVASERDISYCFVQPSDTTLDVDSVERDKLCPKPDSCPAATANETSLLRQYLSANALPAYQAQNFALAQKALRFLNLALPDSVPLFDLGARAQRIAPNLLVDVGHNLHAAEALCATLQQIWAGQKIELIYNAYKDKNYRAILRCFKPLLSKIHILKLTHPRAVPLALLQDALEAEGIQYDYDIFPLHSTRFYAVFGSFSVAESFILQYRERYGQ